MFGPLRARAGLDGMLRWPAAAAAAPVDTDADRLDFGCGVDGRAAAPPVMLGELASSNEMNTLPQESFVCIESWYLLNAVSDGIIEYGAVYGAVSAQELFACIEIWCFLNEG